MANAVLVERVQATAGNAVFVQKLAASTVPPTLNAVFVHNATATAIPPVLNAVFVHKLGTVVSSAAPVANAGPDQNGAEPWSTVTLTGAASTGTISTYGWTQTAGSAVTLSGIGATATFKAPPSMDVATLTFSLVVTATNGLVSTPDSVSITVLPATEFTRVNGAWVPVLIKSRSAGAWV